MISSDKTARILSETRRLIATRGLRAVTMEGISETTGIAKTTLYRRWRNAEELAVAACLDSMDRTAPLPASGSFASRLETLLLHAARFLRSEEGGLLRQIIASAQSNDTIRGALHQQFLFQRRREARLLLDEGVARKTIQCNNVEAALDLMAGPLYHRFLMGHLPLTDDFAKEHASLVLKALEVSN